MPKSDDQASVFFYGLFMDEALLASKGIVPSQSTIGRVDAYRLKIGKRATLLPDPAGRAYGVLMSIRRDDAVELYADESLADYVPVPVSVTLPGGAVSTAIAYVLPPGKLQGANAAYAESLLRLATKLGFPDEYLDTIRREA